MITQSRRLIGRLSKQASARGAGCIPGAFVVARLCGQCLAGSVGDDLSRRYHQERMDRRSRFRIRRSDARGGDRFAQRTRWQNRRGTRCCPALPISINAVGEPRLIADGQKVRVIFEQDGLIIEILCVSLQAGGAGDVISIRNLDSGVTISGIVQTDGTVRVGG